MNRHLNPDQWAQLNKVIHDVRVEREHQHAKWGEQNHFNFCSGELSFDNVPRTEIYQLPTANVARDMCEIAFEEGNANWGHILLEEVCEAFEEGLTPEQLREELIQVAAVAVAWVEAIDRRSASNG